MFIRVTIQNTSAGMQARISKRDDDKGVPIGVAETYMVGSKAEAKKHASDLARSLGLKTYRVVDRT